MSTLLFKNSKYVDSHCSTAKKYLLGARAGAGSWTTKAGWLVVWEIQPTYLLLNITVECCLPELMWRPDWMVLDTRVCKLNDSSEQFLQCHHYHHNCHRANDFSIIVLTSADMNVKKTHAMSLHSSPWEITGSSRAWTNLSTWKHDHISPLLNDLHWLRVPQRIEFKLAVLVYRCFCDTALSYLADELRRVSDMPARQHLRSASTAALDVPVTRRSTIGDRSFSVAAARVWNSLPADVTSAPSLLVFRRLLKTELCRRSLNCITLSDTVRCPWSLLILCHLNHFRW